MPHAFDLRVLSSGGEMAEVLIVPQKSWPKWTNRLILWIGVSTGILLALIALFSSCEGFSACHSELHFALGRWRAQCRPILRALGRALPRTHSYVQHKLARAGRRAGKGLARPCDLPIQLRFRGHTKIGLHRRSTGPVFRSQHPQVQNSAAD